MKDIIPARWRRAAYRVSAAVGLGLGATQVGFASANAGQPTALTVALAVYGFLAGGLGLMAASNTDPEEG